MNKNKRILLVSLLIVVSIVLVTTIVGVFGSVISPISNYCSVGWQQQRLDDLYKKQASSIEAAEAVMSSTILLDGYPNPTIIRVDNKASGDCVDGQPAEIRLTKQIEVQGNVKFIYESVAASLVAQGYVVDAWQSSGGCGNLGPHTYVVKNGIEAQVRITREDVPCSELPDGDDLWNMQAKKVGLYTSITSVGLRP